MPAPETQQRLAALRAVIADIERKPALAEARSRVQAKAGGFPVLGPGLVQEIFTDTARDGGAGLGFALGQARTLLTGRRLAILYVQLAEEAQSAGLPYGPGLAWFGMDPARLAIVRAASLGDLLWTAEEAMACRAVAAILVDIKGSPRLLNFTASRRLSLRAAAGGVSLFMLRSGARREASASHLRWRLSPARSGRKPFDARAPGPARWRLRLEKGQLAGGETDWLLEWTKDGFTSFPAGSAGPDRRRAGTALPGAVPAALGDRLPQTA